MKKCLKMAANSSELLFYCHDCVPNILTILYYNQWCCRGWTPSPFEFQKVNIIFKMILQTKKTINFRGYSLIHISIVVNLESMRLIYPHQAISL